VAEDSHDEPQSRHPVIGPRFRTWTSGNRRDSADI